ncbi:putative integral membrane protein [Desulfosporosinus sp. I2]|uniref:TVP38/TMEM64 family protein n=1 Tax=Desulfosporosinus sp. I2 TaxID=1617025 RepID=UPI0005F09789|nr:TVP38/TMEM64 family protein [Desulfosporosinus sp. I2]KJR46926.1 putative integral membrane protein [Desulfosporosinus sp. I2]
MQQGGDIILSQKKVASVVTICLSLALIWFLYPHLQNARALQILIYSLGWKGIVLDLLIITAQMLFPIVPFALLAGINVILFGPIAGYFISLTGSVFGSSLGFCLARSLGQEWAKPKLQKLGKWAELPESRSFFMVMIGRMIPVLPAAALNYAAGLSSMKFRSYFLATLLGKIPIVAWESWIGRDFWYIFKHPQSFLKALVAGLLLFGGVSLIWYFSSKRKLVKKHIS